MESKLEYNECTEACTMYAHTQHLNFSDNHNMLKNTAFMIKVDGIVELRDRTLMGRLGARH